MTLITSLPVRLNTFAINCFSQYPGTCCFAYSPRPAEQKGMRKLLVPDSIFQRCCNMTLTHYRVECLRTVFPGGNNKFLHAGEDKNKLKHRVFPELFGSVKNIAVGDERSAMVCAQ